MSGSPKTVKRLPAPVFFRSSPISRSAFIRTSSTGIRPSLRSPATLAKPSSVLDGDAVVVGDASDLRVEGEAEDRTAGRRRSALDRLRAASLTNDGLTVPYCGPIAIADPRRRVAVLAVALSPTAWMYVARRRLERRRTRSARCRRPFWMPALREVVEDRLLEVGAVGVLSAASRLGRRLRASPANASERCGDRASRR